MLKLIWTVMIIIIVILAVGIIFTITDINRELKQHEKDKFNLWRR